MKRTEPSPSAQVLKKSEPEGFDLVILRGRQWLDRCLVAFAGDVKRVARRQRLGEHRRWSQNGHNKSAILTS